MARRQWKRKVEGFQATKRSPNLSDTNTSITICCGKKEIIILITICTDHHTIMSYVQRLK